MFIWLSIGLSVWIASFLQSFASIPHSVPSVYPYLRFAAAHALASGPAAALAERIGANIPRPSAKSAQPVRAPRARRPPVVAAAAGRTGSLHWRPRASRWRVAQPTSMADGLAVVVMSTSDDRGVNVFSNTLAVPRGKL